MSHVCQLHMNGCETDLRNGRKQEACDDISSSMRQQFQSTQPTCYRALER